MANLKLTNFTLVNRAWGDIEDAELVAVFQNDNDAMAFAKAAVAHPQFPHQCFLIVTNTYDGKQTIVRRPILMEAA